MSVSVAVPSSPSYLTFEVTYVQRSQAINKLVVIGNDWRQRSNGDATIILNNCAFAMEIADAGEREGEKSFE